MKNEFKLMHCFKMAAAGLLLCSGLFLGGSASAQNLVKNGDFETPNAATNGVVIGRSGIPGAAPADFEILDRTTYVENNLGGYANYWSLGIRPAQEKWCHAYFTQTVSNLGREPSLHRERLDGWKNGGRE